MLSLTLRRDLDPSFTQLEFAGQLLSLEREFKNTTIFAKPQSCASLKLCRPTDLLNRVDTRDGNTNKNVLLANTSG